MRCVINGQPKELPDDAAVTDAVAVLVPNAPLGIAVAVDGDVVPRSQWISTPLADGARVEVLTAVQGG
ncbi:MAG: sulfur carrier protein [Frankiales bacterium]|nr:sulfur carrier protein [Frankiales bacterium]